MNDKGEEGAPEKYVHPSPADSSVFENGAVVDVHPLEHIELVEVRSASALAYIRKLLAGEGTYQVESRPTE